jgi:hypothetical protein
MTVLRLQIVISTFHFEFLHFLPLHIHLTDRLPAGKKQPFTGIKTQITYLTLYPKTSFFIFIRNLKYNRRSFVVTGWW